MGASTSVIRQAGCPVVPRLVHVKVRLRPLGSVTFVRRFRMVPSSMVAGWLYCSVVVVAVPVLDPVAVPFVPVLEEVLGVPELSVWVSSETSEGPFRHELQIVACQLVVQVHGRGVEPVGIALVGVLAPEEVLRSTPLPVSVMLKVGQVVPMLPVWTFAGIASSIWMS